MVSLDVQTTCHDDKSADFVIAITSPQGTPGIDSVVVRALDRSVINKQTPPNCPTSFQFSVGGVPPTALPVYVEVTECQSGVDVGQGKVTTSFGSYGKECVGIVDCKPVGQNQNNQKCIDLQNQITAARNQILTQCGEAASLKSQRDAALATAGVFLAAGVTLLAIAFALSKTPWTIVAGLVLLIAAIALLSLNSRRGNRCRSGV